MRLKYRIVFGAVIITMLLVVSSSNALTVSESDISPEPGNDVSSVINYVEPGIYLSGSEQREMLANALPYVDDSGIYLLLQVIIEKMDTQGFVDSIDIEQIIIDNELDIGSIAAGRIYTGSGNSVMYDDYCPGHIFCPRHPLAIFPVFFALAVKWTAKQSEFPGQPFRITIGFLRSPIPYDNEGLAIGYTGYLGCQSIWDSGCCRNRFNLNGAALLFIFDTCSSNQESGQQITQSINQPSNQPNGTTTEYTTTSSTTTSSSSPSNN